MRYRLSIYPDLDNNVGKSLKRLYNTDNEMMAALNIAAALLLYLQDGLKVMPDLSNHIFTEVLVGGKWHDWEIEDE